MEVVTGIIAGCRSAGIVDTVAASCPTPGAIPIILDVGVKRVCSSRPLTDVFAERSGLRSLLVCLLAQPLCVNLCLLRVSPVTRRPRFLLPCVQLPFLGLTADFSGLVAVRIVALLLYCLAAPSGCEQQHNQRHHNNGKYYPNPRFQITHHFRFDVPVREKPFRLRSLKSLEPA